MVSEKTNLRFWGWGTLDHAYNEKKRNVFLKFLRNALHIKKPTFAPFEKNVDDFAVPAAQIPQGFLDRWSHRGLSVDSADRLLHAVGKSYRDLVRLRSNTIAHFPDGVLFLNNSNELLDLFEDARTYGLVLIPFGGGTGVVGGTECITTNNKPVVVVDLKKLNRLIDLDKIALTATFEAGVLGPDLERELNEQGYTLGHFPQSFEFSTLGGWVATRSAGQNSTKYGKMEHLVRGLTIHTPQGIINTSAAPASATGPSVKELLVGSEGIYGFITQATVKIFSRPEAQRFVPCFFDSLSNGMTAVRDIMQAGLTPSIVRLSDATETNMFLKMALDSLSKKIFGPLWLKLKKVNAETCFCIFAAEGTKDETRFTAQQIKALVKKNSGRVLSASFGKKWEQERFELPYLRDDLMDFGFFIDTLETATGWSRIENIHSEMRRAFSGVDSHQSPPIVACHVSHAYHDGASLYFTFLGAQDKGRELEQWSEIKTTATNVILDNGGALSHHHGIGYDHKQWMEREQGVLGIEVLKNIKQTLDPDHMMNPGKVV